MNVQAIIDALEQCPQFCHATLTANGGNRRYCAVGWLLRFGGMSDEDIATLSDYGNSAAYIYHGEDLEVLPLRIQARKILAEKYNLYYEEVDAIMKANDDVPVDGRTLKLIGTSVEREPVLAVMRETLDAF